MVNWTNFLLPGEIITALFTGGGPSADVFEKIHESIRRHALPCSVAHKICR